MNSRSNGQSWLGLLLIAVFIIAVSIAVAMIYTFITESPNFLENGIIGLLVGWGISLVLVLIARRNPNTASNTTEIYDTRFDVYNTRYILQRLEEEIIRIETQRGLLIVALIEFVYNENEFMKDNTTSNMLLREAVERMKILLPAGHVLGYFEKNTFLVVMPDIEEQEALLIAEAIYQRVSEVPIKFGDTIEADFSINVGMVENNHGVENRRSTIRLAQRALLTAWGAGFESLGFISNNKTLQTGVVQVNTVEFQQIGEFEMPETDYDVYDTYEDTSEDSDLNLYNMDDTIIVNPFLEAQSRPQKPPALNIEPNDSDVFDGTVTQPISPFVLDRLAAQHLKELREGTQETNSVDEDEDDMVDFGPFRVSKTKSNSSNSNENEQHDN